MIIQEEGVPFAVVDAISPGIRQGNIVRAIGLAEGKLCLRKTALKKKRKLENQELKTNELIKFN